MIKSCKGCRALLVHYPNMECKLGFKVDRIIYEKEVIRLIPLVPCPKPLTYDKYFTIVQDREIAARNNFRSKK